MRRLRKIGERQTGAPEIVNRLDEICNFLWSSSHSRVLFYAVLELQEWYIEQELSRRNSR